MTLLDKIAILRSIIDDVLELAEDVGNTNTIRYINDDLDKFEIGLLKLIPNGDYQQRLADEGFTLTEEEAFDLLKVRIINTLQTL
jgi:hypothetical protein